MKSSRFLCCSLSVVLVCLAAIAHDLLAADPADKTETPVLRGLGMVTHLGRKPNWDVAKVLPLLKQMGVDVIREEVGWAGVERTKGNYELPAATEEWFDAVSKAGIRVFLVLDYGNPIYENELDPDAFARYAGWMAKKFKGKVAAYDIWNEPTNFRFYKQYGGERNGSEQALWVAKFSELVAKASAAIREADPQAVIVHNNEGSPWYYALRDYTQDYKLIDGIDIHPYPARYPAETYPSGPENAKYGTVAVGDASHSTISHLDIQCREFPVKFLGRPLQCWVGEYGFSTYEPKFKGQHFAPVTETQQAAYHVRGLITGLAYGVKAWCIYDFIDETPDASDAESRFGLVRDMSRGYDPKPAFYAIQRLARLLGPDWQLAGNVQAKLDVTIPPTTAPADPYVKVNGPQSYWFRVGNDYVTTVWKAGEYEDSSNCPLGKIVWSGAPVATSVVATDLVSGKPVAVSQDRKDGVLTLSNVPVGSSPVAIRWVGAAGNGGAGR